MSYQPSSSISNLNPDVFVQHRKRGFQLIESRPVLQIEEPVEVRFRDAAAAGELGLPQSRCAESAV